MLLICCPFLLVFKKEIIAGYFTNYVYGFLVLGVLGYFLDILRGKIKKKGYFKIYRIVFVSLFVISLISPIVICREDINKIFNIVKINIYINKDNVNSKNLKIIKNKIIVVESPREDMVVSGVVKLSGWAIDTSSVENSGIDKIAIYVDGKPGVGIYLDKEYRKIKEEVEPKEEFLIRLFEGCYDKTPSDKDIILWTHKMETDSNAINDVAKEFFSSEDFLNKNLGNEEYLDALYKILFNRKPDNIGYNYWLTELNKGLDRDILLDKLLDSTEFKNFVRDYYSVDAVYKDDLPEEINLLREDIGNSYGEQFKMSGFIFNFNSSKFENGEHKIYLYAHSAYTGWSYVSFDMHINN